MDVEWFLSGKLFVECQDVIDDLLSHDIDADEAVSRLKGLGVDTATAHEFVAEAYWEHHINL